METFGFFWVRRACCTSEVKVLQGHLLTVKPIATPKLDYREVADKKRFEERLFYMRTVCEKKGERLQAFLKMVY